MKFVDEFRDPARAEALLVDIRRLVERIMSSRAKPLQIMEVCGGHTHSIFRFGLAELLPQSVEFVHGPGCPVCVLPMGVVDDCVALAERPEVIFTTFGDAMRVPGSRKSLLVAKAQGADVRMVYSPIDALKLARENPQREVVFFGLGFETTMPSTALTVQQAEREGLRNFSLFCNHITIIPFRPSRPCSIRPICSSTASSAPDTSRWSSAPRPTHSSPRATASRWSFRDSSR